MPLHQSSSVRLLLLGFDINILKRWKHPKAIHKWTDTVVGGLKIVYDEKIMIDCFVVASFTAHQHGISIHSAEDIL